ncbi:MULTISPECIES: DUF1858 domain-containing protein [unclassified Sedimentibacter]|uniref:DUF1858 domain-containing protein n=1 Tax=unclassified Sedimentibacter TaxID=2649220 RepID=UPI0027E1CD12|nr:DUF1858 domain-containing protein [Sedimentibacter sp. MB35-C1]WMJ77393.1 DUF1858 domain-containing protein [Sedimentibacter sp. MB35-C1]
MEKVTKDMYIGQILQMNQGFADILMNAGMHCLGCPSSQMETLEEAAMVHGFNVENLLEQLNSFSKAE